jgi:hypothetical protein
VFRENFVNKNKLRPLPDGSSCRFLRKTTGFSNTPTYRIGNNNKLERSVFYRRVKISRDFPVLGAEKVFWQLAEMSTYSVNIAVEAPIENQIQEITYDGQEIYQA